MSPSRAGQPPPFFLINPGFFFRRSTAIFMISAWFVVILWLTLGIFANPQSQPNFIPFQSILHDIKLRNRDFFVNFIGNLAGFLPLGFYLPLARSSRTPIGLAIAAGLMVSVLIETLQYFSGNRVCDVDDLILNTTSTVIGYELARWYIAREWERSANRSSKARD